MLICEHGDCKSVSRLHASEPLHALAAHQPGIFRRSAAHGRKGNRVINLFEDVSEVVQ